MAEQNPIFFASELIGTAAFSVAGTLSALRKELDVLGAIIIACLTAVGGGLVRDIILGINPPSMFRNPVYTAVAAAVSVVTLISAYFFKKYSVRMPKDSDEIVNLFDALGIGVFATVGVDTVARIGWGDNGFLTIFIATITCIGGSMMRDICLDSVPVVLRKQVYLLPCAVGSAIYYYLKPHIPELWAGAATVVFIMTIRVLAAHFRWDLPRISLRGNKEDNDG